MGSLGTSGYARATRAQDATWPAVCEFAGTRFEALEPIRQGVRRSLGADHVQKEIAFLGIESSPASVHAPDGNGCAERFIRTLKENLLWVRHFETIEELRQALLAFREVYNTTWLRSGRGYLTPKQFRQNQLPSVVAAA